MYYIVCVKPSPSRVILSFTSIFHTTCPTLFDSCQLIHTCCLVRIEQICGALYYYVVSSIALPICLYIGDVVGLASEYCYYVRSLYNSAYVYMETFGPHFSYCRLYTQIIYVVTTILSILA